MTCVNICVTKKYLLVITLMCILIERYCCFLLPLNSTFSHNLTDCPFFHVLVDFIHRRVIVLRPNSLFSLLAAVNQEKQKENHVRQYSENVKIRRHQPLLHLASLAMCSWLIGTWANVRKKVQSHYFDISYCITNNIRRYSLSVN